MSRKVYYHCCLCSPTVLSRDRKGRFTGGRKMPYRVPSPYHADGRLVSITGRYTPDSASPHRSYCPDCLARMGVKLE